MGTSYELVVEIVQRIEGVRQRNREQTSRDKRFRYSGGISGAPSRGRVEITPANITAYINSIPMLNGTNFKSWKKNLNIVLGVMDLDLALKVDSPPPLTYKSTSNENRKMERWERLNRMCMMIMKKAIPKIFRGTMSNKVKTAKRFMAEIENVFVKSEKAEIHTLLKSLISMRYQGKGNIREYIIQIFHLASKLKALKLDLSGDLLVHLILISLPPQFSQFKMSYTCQKETWFLNEIISHCVQEEDRLKVKKIESVHLAAMPKNKRKHKKIKNKEVADTATQKK
ncbi:uncharacterized protein LOC142168882 [Nicotiana tabacum]|uniref:Uncharacterized protein LOC142168882 n=1 Tax=Nicotiana tabacum TaxID=4097 RepID=A0AC58SMG7_TOBAC